MMKIVCVLLIVLVVSLGAPVRIPVSGRIVKAEPVSPMTPGSSVPLKNRERLMYYGDVHIGTPARTVTVDFDTGSDVLWVPVPDVPSLTLIDSGELVENRYLDGTTITGYLGLDSVGFPGLDQAVNVTLAQFQMPEGGSPFAPSQGIMGLSRLKEGRAMYESKAQGITDKNVFAFEFTRDGSLMGELFVGGYNTELIGDSPMLTLPVVEEDSHWTIHATGVKAGSASISEPVNTVIDTGCSLNVLPESIYTGLITEIAKRTEIQSAGQGLYAVPCAGTYPDLPDFVIEAAGGSMTLFPHEYIFNFRGECVIGFSPNAVPFMIMGDVFMRKYYTIFDGDSDSISFVDISMIPESFYSSRVEPSGSSGLFHAIMGTALIVATLSIGVFGYRRFQSTKRDYAEIPESA